MEYNFKPFSMSQDYESYTSDDREVWKILFERQMTQLPKLASKEYLAGLERVQFSPEKSPTIPKPMYCFMDIRVGRYM
jgi:phenylalanine-4-hydroxylase